MAKRGKQYRAAKEKIDPEKLYSPQEAVALLKETAFTKFDSTAELHVRLGVDPRHADQQVRDVIVLPNGLGKTVRILAFVQGEAAATAEEMGVDFICNDEEGIKRIQNGYTDFDVAIATPDMMSTVGRLGRVLGPRGLMPNPKAGTVVPPNDVARVIDEAKAGRVEFRVDKTANLHVPFGKVSFDEDKLYENLRALIVAIKKARPAASKGTYLRRVTVSSTMGPGIRIDPSLARSLEME
ncbi:MAG: 50S ribosomal protein L1 [Anaerolineales bacterium]|nr:50S ribosomal protein L1 [Anaerolineales bacterium]